LFFAPDGKLLADHKNELWDAAQNKLVKKLVLEGERVIGRGNALLVLTKRDIVKVWDLAGAKICADFAVDGLMAGDYRGEYSGHQEGHVRKGGHGNLRRPST